MDSLQQIEQHHQKVLELGQPFILWEQQDGGHIAHDRDADGQITQRQFQLHVVILLRDCDCRELTNDGHPAQQDQRAQPNPAAAFLPAPQSDVGICHWSIMSCCTGWVT